MKAPLSLGLMCVCSLVVFGCSGGKSNSVAGDPLIQVEAEDAEMVAATAKAKETLGMFLSKFDSNKDPEHTFAVKHPFKTRAGGEEHIWIVVASRANGHLTGEVSNQPYDVENLKQGDSVTFQETEISDWAIFYKDGKQEGYFSEAVLMKHKDD